MTVELIFKIEPLEKKIKLLDIGAIKQITKLNKNYLVKFTTFKGVQQM